MLKSLYLHHFRNYTQSHISFAPGINWIRGKNAHGKTNILEALYLLSTGRSFRTHYLKELIQQGAPYFYLEAEFEIEGVSQSVKLYFDGEQKKLHYNANTYAHFSPLIGLFPHVLYAPEDTALITGTPSLRRKFLDLHLCQLDPLYLYHLTRYYKAMRQRNSLLKNKTEEAIEPWEEMMAPSGLYLMQKREALIKELNSPLASHMATLSDAQDLVSLTYDPSLKEALLAHWKKNRKKELYLGTTLYGPHRDDVHFKLHNMSAKSYASEGQKQCLIASLRLCQREHLSASLGIDDFGAHLDAKRQELLQKQVTQVAQVFITSPHDPSIHFAVQKMIEVSSGKVFQECGT